MTYPIDNSNLFDKITLGFSDYCAGALSSLKFRGKEYVDDLDHGRQIQSAWAIGGESFNPTEAGSSVDGFTPAPSSSQVIDYSINANKVYTKTRMAFWLPVNNKVLSDSYLIKRVTVKHNYIIWETEFIFQPSLIGHCSIEVLTGYMPKEFNKFGRIINKLPVFVTQLGETKNVGFIATPDLQHCMAAYTPGIPQGFWNVGYGLTDYSIYGTNKWNNVFRVDNPKGTYKFTTYIALGNLEEVTSTINILSSYYK